MLLVPTSHGQDLLSSALNVMSQLTAGTTTLDDALSANVVLELKVMLGNWRTSMMEHRTAKLLLMYMSMVKIFRTFIEASHTGNWNVYIHSVHEMLPYLAASAHNNYVKPLTPVYCTWGKWLVCRTHI